MAKKKLSQAQEFDIMKLVLDKFLWLGFVIMAWGLFQLIVDGLEVLADALITMAAGAIVLVIFVYFIVKEYEFIK